MRCMNPVDAQPKLMFDLKNINMNLLLAFDAVASQRSFSRAAKSLGKSQATMSIQVRELERQLDVELITRTTRSLILTQAGEMLARTDRKFNRMRPSMARVLGLETRSAKEG